MYHGSIDMPSTRERRANDPWVAASPVVHYLQVLYTVSSMEYEYVHLQYEKVPPFEFYIL